MTFPKIGSLGSSFSHLFGGGTHSTETTGSGHASSSTHPASEESATEAASIEEAAAGAGKTEGSGTSIESSLSTIAELLQNSSQDNKKDGWDKAGSAADTAQTIAGALGSFIGDGASLEALIKGGSDGSETSGDGSDSASTTSGQTVQTGLNGSVVTPAQSGLGSLEVEGQSGMTSDDAKVIEAELAQIMQLLDDKKDTSSNIGHGTIGVSKVPVQQLGGNEANNLIS